MPPRKGGWPGRVGIPELEDSRSGGDRQSPGLFRTTEKPLTPYHGTETTLGGKLSPFDPGGQA